MQIAGKTVSQIIRSLDWKKIRFLVLIYLVIVSVMIIVLINIPNQYRAQGLYVPSEDMESSSLGSLAGSLGGLAGMAGINLGGSQRDNMKMAIEIIKSKKFIYEIIAKNELAVDLFAAEDWDIRNNKIILNPKVYDENQQKWIRKVKFPKKTIPSDFELFKEFKKRLSIGFDDKTKMLRISFQHYSPFYAKKIVDLVVKSINFDMQQREIKEANTSIDLINNSISQTQFAEMRVLLYELVQEQTKRLLLAETKEYFVLEPIDPPIVAEEKAFPKRGFILIIFTLVFGVFSLLLLVLGTKKSNA